MTENELRDLIARTAEEDAQAGNIYEWSSGLKELIELYNNYPNIGRGIKYTPSLGGWCMLYVSTLFIRNGLGDIIQPEIGAYEPMKNAKLSGNWRERTSDYTPKRGDIIHYAFPRTNEKGIEYTQYHVGIVTNCGTTATGESVIYTTEGNVENRVLMRGCTNWRTNKDIDGFIIPDYEKAASVIVELPPLPKENGFYSLGCVVQDKQADIYWRKEK